MKVYIAAAATADAAPPKASAIYFRPSTPAEPLDTRSLKLATGLRRLAGRIGIRSCALMLASTSRRALDVSPKTAERYRELARLHIRPHLGALKVRAITASRIEELYSDLRKGKGTDGTLRAPLESRTVNHIHRLVVQIFALAERDRVIDSNPARRAKRPKIERTEIEILTEAQIRTVLARLRGRTLYPIVATGLATGLRRGELLALRWKDVELFRNNVARLRVEQSLEQTKQGLRFKAPKTAHSRRSVTLPDFLAADLRAHWKTQQERYLKAGLGKLPDDALVFSTEAFETRSPNALTKEWSVAAKGMGLSVTLHAWRHTHASQLIASGMDVLTISRRLGHSNPTTTLAVYGHLFTNSDARAAQIMQAAFGRECSP